MPFRSFFFLFAIFPTEEPGPWLIIYHCQTTWNIALERLKKKRIKFQVFFQTFSQNNNSFFQTQGYQIGNRYRP